jgi:glutathione synthase/RimK-type ligase-like ATP-grasp enzyme
LTASALAWLAGHGRRIVNGPRALDLEISKARQYAALEAAGIRTPKTVLVAGANTSSPRHVGISTAAQ